MFLLFNDGGRDFERSLNGTSPTKCIGQDTPKLNPAPSVFDRQARGTASPCPYHVAPSAGLNGSAFPFAHLHVWARHYSDGKRGVIGSPARLPTVARDSVAPRRRWVIQFDDTFHVAATRLKSRPTMVDALERLFDRVREGVYLGWVSPGSSITVLANPHLKLILGYDPETPPASVRPFDPDRFADPDARASFLQRLDRDGSVTDYLLRLRRADDTPVWLEITAHAHETDQGLRLEALLRDVTERKKLEEQARDLYQQLLQAEKLAVLGQTISGVAHELNNPLATILTLADRLSRQQADPLARRHMDTIQSEATRAARIVRNLLTFARKRQTTRTLVDLNQVVRETLALRVYEQRVHNISVIDALAAGLPDVFVDPHQLQQVLLNLIVNAEHAMVSAHGRGTLLLRSWFDVEAGMIRLEINDDGPGVQDAALPKIFDPFFTTKEVGKGTGLGLTVAIAIVQEHGGQLTVASAPSSGASFFVALPVSGPASTTTTARATPLPVDVGHGAAVLVVDDEPALAAAVAEGLEEAGFRVDCAADGEEALARVRERHYDVVICDLRMPRLDGPAFYRAIAATSPTLARRVIFATGDVVGTEAERFLTESGCRWLPKPFRLVDLVRTAREVVG